ncbi:ATP-binding cassette domain-containing protein [Streptomyces sp. NPDC056352]|uniref:ATP-binding cassette domain-containing protein n=1 Tax=Streptomyces sp. NPDC056352 TaxID=3345791 RepID=UPI0035DD99BF
MVIVPHHRSGQPFGEHKHVHMAARDQGLREPLHAMTEFTEDVHGLPKRSGEVTAPDGLDLGIRPGEEPAPPVERGREEHRGGNPPGESQPRRGKRSRRSARPRVRRPSSAFRVEVVRQDESAPAELTVRERVVHFARSRPRPRDATDVIAMAGPERYADTWITAFSWGRRRRLDVALGVIVSPGLMVLDEPTTGFDPPARRRFRELLRHQRPVPARRTGRAQGKRRIRPASAGSRPPARPARPAAARPTPCP